MAATSGGEASVEIGPKALYGGSFDPPTLGHLDVIERAAKIFPQVEVNVAANPDKPNQFFTVEKRLELIEAITADLGNVSVGHLPKGFLAAYARDNGFTTLIRGLRSERDFGDELTLLKGNKMVTEEVDTIYIPARPDFDVVSSSLVKQILAAGDPNWEEVVAKIVPEPVMDAIVERQAGQA